jgi:NET1-associated nuclear protein 1 (U3 small nucleolar RNA-associated protein 17)
MLVSTDDNLVMRISTKATTSSASRELQEPSETVLIGKGRLICGLGVSPGGAWLVAVGGHKAQVASTANPKAGFTNFVSPDMLTCLAFHPSEEYFATGDSKGVVRLWYCLNSEHSEHVISNVEKRAVTTTLHWHAHPVASLAFSVNGAYLLSGGEETVLVIWQLHSGKKEFVPRVGAPIHGISVSRSNHEEYLLSLADASFIFVSASTLRIARSFARIKLGM